MPRPEGRGGFTLSDFKSVPVEDDTTVLFQREVVLGEFQVLYQKWVWDGIKGESLIFLGCDVRALSDEQLISEVRSSPLVDDQSKVTMKRSDSDYIFVNFNFS